MTNIIAILGILGTATIALLYWGISATVVSNVDGAMNTAVSQTNNPAIQQAYQTGQNVQNLADNAHDAVDFAKGPKIIVYFGIPATIVVGVILAILRSR